MSPSNGTSNLARPQFSGLVDPHIILCSTESTFDLMEFSVPDKDTTIEQLADSKPL
jgi:hypothetical protein